MLEEENDTRYFCRDFEWEGLRDEVERDPSFSYHLSPFPTSISSPPLAVADTDAWRTFHRRHSTGKFFKERRYLLKEFSELNNTCEGSINLLEVGCGNGSTILPILRAKQNILIYACDCSQNAVDKASEMVATTNLAFRGRFFSFLLDFSVNKFPDWLLCIACQMQLPRKNFKFMPDGNGQGLIRLNKPACLDTECCIGGIDFVTLIFTLSAIPFQRMPFVVEGCMSVLKPGGLVLFRDYGLFDMTMLRFPPEQRVGFREYRRSDGTLSYFFSLDIVRNIFLGAGFIELELEYCCVISLNHCTGKKMQRVWVHGKFQKPILGQPEFSS